MLKQVIRLNREDMHAVVGVPLGTFVVIHVITACALLIFFPCDSVFLAGTLALVFSAFDIFTVAMGHIMVTFTQTVQFGQTRRRALRLSLGVIGFDVLVNLAVLAALSMMEWLLAPRFWQWLTGATGYQVMENARAVIEVGTDQGFVLGIDTFFLEWQAFPLVLMIAAAIGVIGGAVILRFGKRGGWTMWGIWMACCFGLPHLPWRQYTIVDWLIPLTVVLLVAGFVWSLWLLLRMAVK